MKKMLWITMLGAAAISAFGQPSNAQSSFQERVNQLVAPAPPELPRFDIDFPGGTAKELVEALNKPLRGGLNVLITREDKDVEIPPFKFQNVNVSQVFSALMRISQKRVEFETGPRQRRTVASVNESFEFNTPAPIMTNSIWSFRAIRGNRPAEVSTVTARYYQLGPHLEHLKIEDIVTTIETGWKMLGIQEMPKLKFHPETKLLVAVGLRDDLIMIDDALSNLAQGFPRKDPAPPTTEAKK